MAEEMREIEEDEIIELINDSGEHEFFKQVAVLPYGNDWFICLKPCTEDGIDLEDDVFFLKIDESDDGQDLFEVVTDEKILSDLYDEIMNSDDEDFE